MIIANIFITFILLIFLVYITCYLISIIQVFIWYQKLDGIAVKYSFIVQNYGDLTLLETEELYEDLNKGGFNLEKININVPKDTTYGELVEFSINYKLEISQYFLNMNTVKNNIDITVKKQFYITK